MLLRLPIHEIKLFREFARAEAFAVEARIKRCNRAIRWLVSPVLLTTTAIRVYRYGRQLGLPIATMQRAAQAELDDLNAPPEVR